MHGAVRWLAGAVGIWLLGTPAAHAVIYGGGGGSVHDCLLVFDAPVNDPETRPVRYRCTDGDPDCDADGIVNGQCLVPVAVCANSTFNPTRCTPDQVDAVTVAYAEDDGDPKFDPDFQALQTRIDNEILDNPAELDRCTTATNIRVPIVGPLPGGKCRRGRKMVRVTTLFISGPQVRRDADRLKLVCDPPSPCNAQVLFSGTFDRVQRQIFSRSCALSGCHDSQSQAGGMLLESGGAYSNVADAVPTNTTAAGLGWRRVDVTNASATTSFLYRKVDGDLPDPDLEARMPFGRRALDRFLIDILRLWIEAGAPQAGWVPGTD